MSEFRSIYKILISYAISIPLQFAFVAHLQRPTSSYLFKDCWTSSSSRQPRRLAELADLLLYRPAPEVVLQELIAVSEQIFGQHARYSDLRVWQQKLASGLAAVARDRDTGQVLAFATAYAGTAEQHSLQPLLHVWLAGTVQEARGAGLMTTVLKCLVKVSPAYGVGVSVHTIPERFEAMYKLCLKLGFRAVPLPGMEAGKVRLEFRR